MSQDLYRRYHANRFEERRTLFTAIRKKYDCRSGLYPGCFVHITPSFYFPEMVYVDNDLRAKRFFSSSSAKQLVEGERDYSEAPRIKFFHQDYRNPVPIPRNYFDLLISQYAGFVSEFCLGYLKTGGILLANNSHGDAGLAKADVNLRFIGTVRLEFGAHMICTGNLDKYFIPALPFSLRPEPGIRDYLKQFGKGLRYQVEAEHYLFQKIT